MRITEEQLIQYGKGKEDTLTNAELSMIKELLEYKEIEKELGIDLITLFTALLKGYYRKDKDGNITFCKTKKPNFKTIESDIFTGELHFTNLEICEYEQLWYFKDYGKTWALTKEELL